MLLVKAAAGIAAGLGLLQRQDWGRVLAIVLGVISLINIPFGTALGIYTLWVLVSPGADKEYADAGAGRGRLIQFLASEFPQLALNFCARRAWISMYTLISDTAAGVTPGMRLACPRSADARAAAFPSSRGKGR